MGDGSLKNFAMRFHGICSGVPMYHQQVSTNTSVFGESCRPGDKISTSLLGSPLDSRLFFSSGREFGGIRIVSRYMSVASVPFFASSLTGCD